MAVGILARKNYGRKWPVSIKCHNLHCFKDGVILWCQSILETRRISHLFNSALFTIPLKTFRIIFNEMAIFLFWFSGDVFREHEQIYLWPRETQVLRNNLWTVQFSLKASKFLGGHGSDIWILKYFSDKW